MIKSNELKVAIETAKKVGKFLKYRHGSRRNFTIKKISSQLSKDTRKGFQTEEDIKAERMILEDLKFKFPQYGFLSEESKPIGINKEYLWVIDPLEGTIAYIHGLENYGTAIALLRKTQIILGVVYCPTLEYLFWAEKNSGAYFNGMKINVSKTNKITDSLISIEHKIFRQGEKYPRVVTDLVKSMRRLRVGESCGQELCYVACGKTDALIKTKQPLYDYAAGKVILEEAGGVFTDLDGQETKIHIDPETGINFLASNGKIHKEVLKYFDVQ